MQKNHRLSLGLALALGSSEALALGLGAIRVSSSLNEPLVAEIPIISSTPGELDNLKVKLASPDAFSRVGVDRTALLPVNLEFTVVKNAAGQPVVRVTTPTRLGEPILNFLLEVEWGRGRMLREYTVLLDPPRVAPARTAPAVTAPVREPAAAPAQALAPSAAVPPPPPPPPVAQPAAPAAATAPAAPPRPAPEPAPLRPAAAPTPLAPPSAPTPSASISGDRYGPVGSGETLWAIAQQVRPDSSVSMNQTMLALLRANPDAFIGDNINRLKRGAVLRIPTRDELSALTAAAAAAEVSEQTQAWRDAPAGASRDSVSVPAEPVQSVESTRVSPASTAPSAARLELLPPGGDTPASAAQSGSSDSGPGRELRADLGRAREQVATLQEENRDLRSRVTDLERLDGDTKRLIELKDSQLADAQRRLAELEAERTRLEGLASAAPVGVDTPPEEALIDPLATQATDADAAVSSAPDAFDTDPMADPLAVDPDAAMDGSAVDAPIDEQVPAGAVPVDVPVAVQPVAEPEPAATQALDEPAPADAKPWYLQTWAMLGGLLLVIGGLLAFLLGRRRGSSVPPEPRESIADQYEAATAEAATRDDDPETSPYSELDRLLDAVAEQPNDLGRHLALVGHYYRQSDASGFEGAAEAMYAQLYDADHPSWRQVVVMGRDLLPDHPLFFEVPAEASPARPAFDPLPASPAPLQEADDDWGAVPSAPVTRSSPDTTQNFSTEDIDRLRVAASAKATPDDPFDSRRIEVPDVVVPAISQPPKSESTDWEYRSDEDGDDAAATKLELARAYLDMGDVEGARGMLDEVIGEGNPGQRAEARRLLDEIR